MGQRASKCLAHESRAGCTRIHLLLRHSKQILSTARINLNFRLWGTFSSGLRRHRIVALPMLTKRIIPCLDCDRGRVVKGVKFFDHVDAGDPVEQASRYQTAGADELVFYDITASHEGRDIMADLVRRVMENIFMPLTVGGGIRTLDDATRLIQAGAEKVSVNSAAVRNPKLLAEISRKFGRCATVLGLDANRVKKEGAEIWEVFVAGGRVGTGIKVMDWVEQAQALGAGEIVLNVMNADGT